jgi:hypothetical protein
MANFNLFETLDESQKKIQNNGNNNGFVANSVDLSGGNGLPFLSVPPEKSGETTRHLIHWFVPQFGTIQMYINPESINYRYAKKITTTQTKGGYVHQYWGEELPKLTITGSTGSSGIEGINVLYEIYRAEQYAFDGVGLALAAKNQAQEASGLVTSLIGDNAAAGVVGGLLDTGSNNFDVDVSTLPDLATLAFGVEMYYNGWVFRGFFNDFQLNESASDFLLRYTISFTVTQRRGYRTNYFPFHRSPNGGGKNSNTPYSFKK